MSLPRVDVKNILALTLIWFISICDISYGQDAIPKTIIERADTYIIGKVGEKYFKDNYKFRSGRVHIGRKHVEYFLHYEYYPFSRIGAEKERVFVRMFDIPDYTPDDYVACIKGGKVCEPRITRDEALERIKKKDIEHFSKETAKIWLGRPSPINDMINWTWVIHIPVSESGDCETYIRLWVDAVTGRYTNIGQGQACI